LLVLLLVSGDFRILEIQENQLLALTVGFTSPSRMRKGQSARLAFCFSAHIFKSCPFAWPPRLGKDAGPHGHRLRRNEVAVHSSGQYSKSWNRLSECRRRHGHGPSLLLYSFPSAFVGKVWVDNPEATINFSASA
jgi:hypothetical protein